MSVTRHHLARLVTVDPNVLAEYLASYFNANDLNIDGLQDRVGDAVADIADPSSATAEDCANAINLLLASLRSAGLLAL